MGRKQESNFKKAMNELLGAELEKKEILEEVPSTVQEVKPESEFLNKQPEPEILREEAVIPIDMVVSGNVTTKSDMIVKGSVIGDIVCGGNILLQGNVQGNVSSENLTIQGGGLTGEVNVKENLMIEGESVLTGDVTAQNIYSNATIEGQLKAAEMVELKENALVKGDLFARNISVKSGARIKGMITISE